MGPFWSPQADLALAYLIAFAIVGLTAVLYEAWRARRR